MPGSTAEDALPDAGTSLKLNTVRIATTIVSSRRPATPCSPSHPRCLGIPSRDREHRAAGQARINRRAGKVLTWDFASPEFGSSAGNERVRRPGVRQRGRSGSALSLPLLACSPAASTSPPLCPYHAYWLVVNDCHTSAGRVRAEQPQVFLVAAVTEEGLACAEHDGMDHEPELVDEVVLHQQSYQRAAAVDQEVPTRVKLEFRDLFSNVSLDPGRVPLHLLNRS